MTLPIAVYMPRFYADDVLVPLGYIAVAMAGARALDALTDPVVGWLTDRTRTRWGRRLPWITLAVPLSALSFFALFNPPEALDGAAASLWFAAAFSLYYLFYTMVEIPHQALGAELTLDYRERSSLFGYKAFFIAGGSLVGSMLPWLLQTDDLESRQAYRNMGMLCGAVIVVSCVPLVLKLRERPEFSRQKANPLTPGIRRAFRNRPFRILLLSKILYAIPLPFSGIMWPFYIYYLIQPADPLFWLTLTFACYLLVGFSCIPLWVRMAQRFGKRPTWIFTALLGVACYLPFFFFLGVGQEILALVLCVITGIPASASVVLGPAMGSDTIDYDEFRTGKRREGQIFAFWAIIPKFVMIPSAAMPLAVLAAVGYIPNAVQSPDVVLAIRLLYTVPPVILWIPAALAILWYPITESVHLKIREGIEAHGRGQGSRDPITGEWVEPPQQGEDEETSWRLDYFSRRELGQLLTDRPKRVVASVTKRLATSLGIFSASALLAIRSVADPSVKPGLVTVAWIAAAGFSLTAAAFHAARLRPALRLIASPVPGHQIAAHARAIDGLPAPL